MADILLDFPIQSDPYRVFLGISTPAGLDAWWSKRCSGTAREGAEFQLWFGPEYDWRAVVTRYEEGKEFELKLTVADKDWLSTRVGLVLKEVKGITQVQFHHLGWPEANEHYRISCFCWAMYLRHLKRYIEEGIVVAYEDRLDT